MAKLPANQKKTIMIVAFVVVFAAVGYYFLYAADAATWIRR